jgi:hypothetical protein
MRRVAVLAAIAVIAVGAAFLSPQVCHLVDARAAATVSSAPPVPSGSAPPAPSAAGNATQSSIDAPLLAPRPVSIHGTVFFGWSLLDRRTGAIAGSSNRESGTNSTESMIKAWIASDYLRRLAAAGHRPTATALHELTLMIIDSNDNMAQKYYVIDGQNAVVQRLISMCGLRDTHIYSYWWSKTQMSPADAARYGNCVASGRAAGPIWTSWILNTMTHVRGGIGDQQRTTGGGRWGIISALPLAVAATTSIKNGWTAYDGVWHVNCMAIQKDWVLAVMMRYAAGKGLAFGAGVCASVTQQLSDDGAADRVSRRSY